MLRSPTRLRYDDEDDDVSHCDMERMPCDILSLDMQSQDTRRASFIAHSSNGRTKYRSNEKTRDGTNSPIVTNETCIWFPVYSDGKRKKCYSARIVKLASLTRSYRVISAYTTKLILCSILRWRTTSRGKPLAISFPRRVPVIGTRNRVLWKVGFEWREPQEWNCEVLMTWNTSNQEKFCNINKLY